MFENVGQKIQAAARTLFWIGVIAGSIGAFVGMVNAFRYGASVWIVFVGLLGVIAGFAIWWVLMLCLHGFGQLVENSEESAGRNTANESTGNNE